MNYSPRRARTGFASALTLLAIGAGGAEAQVYNFEQASYTVTEGPEFLKFVDIICVVRTGDLSNRIDALVSTVDGTATSSAFGMDFLAWNEASFQFPAGVARRCGLLGIFDDPLEEGVEEFTVRIVHVFPGGQVGPRSEATVTILDDDAPSEDLVFRITDNGHRWGDDPVIPYEITVENNGPPQSGLVVTEIVPAYTVFVPAESTPGWVCEPGPDEGSACRFAIGELAAGGSHTLIFAARVVAGTPAEVEIYDEAFLDLESSLAFHSGRRTCVAELGGYCVLWLSSFADLGCLCLFNLCESTPSPFP
jgi:hypothetical protein